NTYSVLVDSPYQTLADLIKAAKEKPEGITTGDGGLMSDDHMSVLSLQKKADIKFNMTHFDGGGAAQTALHGGHVQVLVGNIGDAMSGYKSGKFRVLAITSEKRSPLLPDVPTLKEQGVDLVTAVARGLVAPAGTPPEVIKILSDTVKKIDGMKDYQDKMASSGLPTLYMDSAEYDKYLQAEEKRVDQLIKELD
ncbi:MAG: tripartite tricarboxylate transporter substrate binding protein, partial [Chloroflexota bacterium]